MQIGDAAKKVLVFGTDVGPANNKELSCAEHQSCMAFLEEGYRVALITNTGAEQIVMLESILQIPVYQVPFKQSFIEEIITEEAPDLIYTPVVGSAGWEFIQQLAGQGFWKKHGIQIIGQKKNPTSISEIKQAVANANLGQCQSFKISSLEEAEHVLGVLGGFPVVLRTQGHGVSIITTPINFRFRVLMYLDKSDHPEIFVEECLTGCKEIEVGILRDAHGKAKVIVTTENIMPVGIHSVDSMAVTPIQTLSWDQKKRVTEEATRLVEKLNDFVGYCTVQFAVNADNDSMLITGVDFSTDRLTAAHLMLGYPIIKVVTKLTMGITLQELETSIQNRLEDNRILLKVPQFNFTGSNNGDGILSSRSKSLNEKIYAGHSFSEAFNKVWEVERKKYPLNGNGNGSIDRVMLRERLLNPYWDQIYHIYQAFSIGTSVEEIEDVTSIAPWFLEQIQSIVAEGDEESKKVLASGKNNGEQRLDADFSESHFNWRKKKRVDSEKKLLVLSDAHTGNGSLPLPSLVLITEARRMGFEIVLVNGNTKAVPFWMSFVDRMYLEDLIWDSVHKIYQRENPHRIFIEGSHIKSAELVKQFTDIGAPIVEVPTGLGNQMLEINRDSVK